MLLPQYLHIQHFTSLTRSLHSLGYPGPQYSLFLADCMPTLLLLWGVGCGGGGGGERGGGDIEVPGLKSLRHSFLFVCLFVVVVVVVVVVVAVVVVHWHVKGFPPKCTVSKVDL